MRLRSFDMDEFVEINKLKPITSPTLMERGGVPNPDGLVSNEIFGVQINERKENFAYIDLKSHFIHPHMYKAARRVFRNIDTIVNGTARYKIVNKKLVKDPDGETGIKFLYENWNKIDWVNNNKGMSGERGDLLNNTKKDHIFIDKMVVIPAFYRDIHTTSGGGEVIEINNFYTKLIRMASMLDMSDGMWDFSFHGINYNIQQTLVDIYDDLKRRLDKKNGMIHKSLLGKNVDYSVRTVITAMNYLTNDPRDNIVDFTHAAVPLSQLCVLFYPQLVKELKDFFYKEIFASQFTKIVSNINDDDTSKKVTSIIHPESIFNDEYISKHINRYVDSPTSRFDLIELDTADGPKKLVMYGTGIDGNPGTISKRYMTWTDLLFIAINNVIENKHVMCTRYPLLDNFGIFFNKIRVFSTIRTQVVKIGNKIYKWYPVIDIRMPKQKLTNNFRESINFHNSYLDGLDGDFDGDQITVKGLWTVEANAEADEFMKSIMYFMSPSGVNRRTITLEGLQTFYSMTI